MDAQVKQSPVLAPEEAGAPDPTVGTPLTEELETVGKLFSDTIQLAALEAQQAISSAAKALILVLLAMFGALMAAIFSIVALAFGLQALGLPWAAALSIVAVIIIGLCYLAIRMAGRLSYRVTLPLTRQAFSRASE